MQEEVDMIADRVRHGQAGARKAAAGSAGIQGISRIHDGDSGMQEMRRIHGGGSRI